MSNLNILPTSSPLFSFSVIFPVEGSILNASVVGLIDLILNAISSGEPWIDMSPDVSSTLYSTFTFFGLYSKL